MDNKACSSKAVEPEGMSKEEFDRLEGLRYIEEAETITEPEPEPMKKAKGPEPPKDIDFPLSPGENIY